MGRRSQGEGSLYQRGDGYWCASVRLPNGKRITKYAKVKKDASRVLGEMTQKQRSGRLVAPSKLTVGEWLIQWLDGRRASLRPTTLRTYESVIRVHLLPTMGTVRLSRVTPAFAGLIINEVAEDHPHMAQVVRRVLLKAFALAVDYGMLAANPIAVVENPRAGSRDRERWTSDQFQRFVQASETMHWGPLWQLLVGTGLRIGEALGLEWRDIDLDAQTLSVRRAVAFVGSRPVLGEPKTRSSRRTVGVPSFVLASLSQWKVRQAEEQLRCAEWFDERGAVFTTPSGTTPGSGVLWKAFQVDCARASVPPMRIHDLRHVHASLAVMAGADPKTLQARLGHRTLDMTMSVYAHRVDDNDRDLVSRIETLASGGA